MKVFVDADGCPVVDITVAACKSTIFPVCCCVIQPMSFIKKVRKLWSLTKEQTAWILPLSIG